MSLLYVEDFANAVADSVKKFDECVGGIYEIDDGTLEGYSWCDIIEATRRSYQPVISIRIAPRLLSCLATINETLAKFLNYSPMLTVGKVKEIREERWLCENSEFTAATGWEPKYSLKDGLELTFKRS